MKTRTLNTLGWALTACFAVSAQAQIYKWKDEHGRWQFSDTPPAHLRDQPSADAAADADSGSSGDSAQASSKDLRAQLAKRYGDLQGLNQTTQAVVAIETAAGSGSGFFVSERGHLVTNHHVIRPARFEGWQEATEKLESAQRQLAVNKPEFDAEKETLKSMQAELEQQRKDMERESRPQIKRELEERFTHNQQVYKQRKANYDKQWQRFSTQLKDIEKQLADLRWKASLSNMASTFKVYLKDDTVLNARLVSISEGHDLALLQLEGYLTPSLPLQTKLPSQGDKVHAIGSPLGMRDSVTAGIVTRLSEDTVFTDAKILPGNSGGPLVNENGEVIGVNTQKFAQHSVMGEGFGMAIPASVVRKEFQRWLPDGSTSD